MLFLSDPKCAASKKRLRNTALEQATNAVQSAHTHQVEC